ncbi:MAG: arsenate reductase family protein [Pleomorphochaeta sp.]
MIQIIGTKKCKETQKAIRAAKERRIEFQFVDLKERDLSKKEWESIFNKYDAEELIDKESKLYKKKGFSYMVYDAREELEENSDLLITPIIRCKQKVNKGFDINKIIDWSK